MTPTKDVLVVLCAAIGVEYRALDERRVPGDYPQRVDHQVGTEMVGHGVSDAGFGVTVDDGGEIQSALPGRNIGVMRSCA